MFVKMYLDLINSISDDFFAAVDKAILDSMKLILGLIIVIAAPLLVLGKSPHVIFIFADDLGNFSKRFISFDLLEIYF